MSYYSQSLRVKFWLTECCGVPKENLHPLESLAKEVPYYKYLPWIKPLSANPTKWSNTLKQIVGKLSTNCLNVFQVVLKGSKQLIQ